MRTRRIPLLAVLAALALAATTATPDPSDDDKPYLGKNIANAEAKEKLKDKEIAIKDIYGQRLRSLSGIRGYTLRRYEAFTTQGGFGSDMICVIPKSDKEAVETLQEVLPNSKVLLYGKIRRVSRGRYVFEVDKLIRGHKVPIKRHILLTIQDHGKKRKKTYKCLPGKMYRIPDPNDERYHIYFTIRQ